MLRIACPSCRLIFLQLAASDEEGVTCPRCGTVFHPAEEELVDPDDD